MKPIISRSRRSRRTLRAGITTLAVVTALIGALLATAPLGAAETYTLQVSNSPLRQSPAPLEGSTLSSNVYVFVAPDAGASKVEFFLDDPQMASAPRRVENSAPWDFVGALADGSAKPFNTASIANGQHTITARVTLTGGAGTQVVHGVFTVANGSPTQYALQFSTSTDRSNPSPLDGAAVAGDLYAFTAPDAGVTRVRFYIDNVAAAGTPYRSETGAPFDLEGTKADGNAKPYPTSRLVDGAHTLTVRIDVQGGATQLTTASFTVRNHAPRFVFTPPAFSLQVDDGSTQPAVASIQLTTSAASSATFTVSDNAPWLTVQPGNGSAPATLNITADPAGLAAGSTYNATVTVSGSDASGPVTSAALPVSFQVGNPDCVPVACEQIRVSAPYTLEFDGDAGGAADANGVGTGFTYIDPPTNGQGYLPQNLEVVGGSLRMTTTKGRMATNVDSQDNALAVGIPAANAISDFTTTVTDIPAGTGKLEQAGLWFGTDEDNYSKLTVLASPNGLVIEHALEVNGSTQKSTKSAVLALAGRDVTFTLRADPSVLTVAASYSIDGGSPTTLGTNTVPSAFFSADGAGIDPRIGTRSFAGVYATHANATSLRVYNFERFAFTATPTGGQAPGAFIRTSFPVSLPTSMVWGPDDRLYVSELFGTIHAFTLGANNQVLDHDVITALGTRMTLGLAIDPAATSSNVILWASHSSPSIDDGEVNSGVISRLSGPGLTTRQDVITGLPRAKANHGLNSLHFGPDGRLYIAAGGNTGSGSPNTANTEFGDRPEQPLSSALLVADVKASGFQGACATPLHQFGIPATCDVTPWATGLRNMYDFAFHSNGQVYGADNGLGVIGTYPPSPTPDCTGLANVNLHNPGEQPDRLQRLQGGKYYGHPNPYRNECVFFDGSKQGVAPLPNFEPSIFNLGRSKSANGMVEYRGDAFCGSLRGELLVANYSRGDDITRIRLSADGRSVIKAQSLIGGFTDPLPLAQSPNGTIFVGEFGVNKVTALAPQPSGCWTTKQPMSVQRLDSGGTALDGKVYVVAGKTTTAHQSTVQVYHPATNTWSTVANLPGPAVENPAVVAHDGKLYVFGGGTSAFSGAVTNAAVFDPLTGQWTSLAPMPVARGGPGAGAIGNTIYVVGGLGITGESLNSVSVYNVATGAWTTGTPMAQRRDNPGVAALGGKLYAFGGRTRNADGTTVDGTLDSVESFDPSTGNWTASAPMLTGRRTPVVASVNGRALVIGGEAASDGSPFSTNEEYDPVTNSWRTLTPMPTGRHGAAGGAVDGVVYVIGGGPQGGTTTSNINEAFSLSG